MRYDSNAKHSSEDSLNSFFTVFTVALGIMRAARCVRESVCSIKFGEFYGAILRPIVADQCFRDPMATENHLEGIDDTSRYRGLAKYLRVARKIVNDNDIHLSLELEQIGRHLLPCGKQQ